MGDDEKVVENMVVENLAVVVDVALWSCDGGLRSFYDEPRSHQHRILGNYCLMLGNCGHLLSDAPETNIFVLIYYSEVKVELKFLYSAAETKTGKNKFLLRYDISVVVS